VFKM